MTQQGAQRGGWYPYYVVGVLMLAFMCAFIDRTILGLLIDPVKHDLGLTEIEVSLLVGFAFAMFYTVLGLPFGWMADRGSRTRLIFWGVVFWSLMTAACGLARSFGTLFAARIGVGVGEATLSPASYSLLPDYFERERLGLAASIYASGITVGGGLAMLLGGAMVQAFADAGIAALPLVGAVRPWQLAFLVVGLLGLPIALLVLTIREPRHANPQTGGAGLGEAMRYLRDRAGIYAPVILAYSLMVVVSYALVTWVPAFYMRKFALGPLAVGAAVGPIMLIAGTAGLLFGGLLSDRLARRGHLDAPLRVVLISVVGQAPFFIAATLVDSQALSLGLMTMAVFLMTMHGGLQGATIQVLTPARMRGQMMAVYLVVANLIGLGLGPTLIATFTDRVFGDPLRLGDSLALATAITLPLSALLIAVSLGRARAQVLAATTE